MKCADCGREFILSAGEADFFAAKGLSQPRRCGPCRQLRRQHAIDAARLLDPATE